MIFDAADRPLNQNTGGLPDVSGALANWFQPLTFTSVTKTIVNFDLVEVPTEYVFQGVWQPMSEQKLKMMPEGQRKWRWFTVHAEPGLALDPDEVITYLGEQFRVMGKLEYKLYGFNEYHLANDYTKSGP